MAIQFRCAECSSLMQVGEEFAGRKVRCPKCQAVATAPAPAAPSPTPREALTERRPTEPPPVPPPTARPRRHEDDYRDWPPPRRRDRRPVESSSAGLIAALIGGGVFLLVVVLALVLWVVFSPEERPFRKVVVGPKADGWGAAKPNGPVAAPIFPQVQPPPFKVDEFKPRIDPVIVRKEEPFPPVPPIKVALVKGTFETKVDFDTKVGEPNNFRLIKRYQFEVKPSLAYWIHTQDNFRVSVSVEGPAGPVPLAGPPGGSDRRLELAFVADKPGTYTAVLECDRFESKPCKLRIREMDGTEPLPQHLKLPPASVVLPLIEKVVELNVYDKQFSGAAFAPDSKSFWIAHGDGTLSYWEYPSRAQKGSFKVKDIRLYAMGVDSQGRLYAQMVKGERGPLSIGERVVADISVWEGLKPSGDMGLLPAPHKTIPLHGIVQRLIYSPDGRWLYFLDSHNRKIGRIDAKTATIDKELDNLSSGAKGLCLTPDGKKLYCCADSNRIDVIDAAAFKLIKTVRLDKGQPFDIAASNEGLLFLVGQNIAVPGSFGMQNCTMVDLTKGLPDEAKVLPVPIGHHCRFVLMLPDQRAALFSGDRKVTPCSRLLHAGTHRAGARWPDAAARYGGDSVGKPLTVRERHRGVDALGVAGRDRRTGAAPC